MGRSRIAFGALIVSLSLITASEAAAKSEHCCWRVDVQNSGGVHAIWDNAGEGGGGNGTYDLTWTWQARALMQLDGGDFFTGILRRGNFVPGKARFSAMESSDQSRNNAQGQPVPFGPCSYPYALGSHSVPGGSLAFAPVQLYDDAALGSGLFVVQDVSYDPGPYVGDCSRLVPNYYANGVLVFSDFLGSQSFWTAFDASIYRRHWDPNFKVKKLKKTKDFAITFDESVALTNDTGDSRWDHTGSAPITIHIDFKWFPRDALQREINGLSQF